MAAISRSKATMQSHYAKLLFATNLKVVAGATKIPRRGNMRHSAILC
jgi:hypothetical protein